MSYRARKRLVDRWDPLLDRIEAFLKRVIQRRAAANPSPGYSYRIYWTKTTWNWPGEKRERILARVKELISADDFIQSPYERLYRIDELGEREYSGESLSSLAEVLAAYTEIDEEGVKA